MEMTASSARYADLPIADLLSELESAGRTPPLELISALLDRGPEAAPGLLDMLAAEEDPRWYRAVQAGQLLCVLREPDALPLFARIWRDPEWADALDWFDMPVPYCYGPLATPIFADMAQDGSASFDARIAATDALSMIGVQHPQERERIALAMRALLPALDPDGRPVLTQEERDDPPELWTWAVSALMDIRDVESQPLVAALFREDVIDEYVFGGLEDYWNVFGPDARPHHYANYRFDILETYERLHRQAAQEAERVAADVRRKAWEAKRPQPRPAGKRVKVGRNDPCPCGSGKKFKKCCDKRS